MRKINNEQILDRIYDLADANGVRIDDFIAELEDTYGEKGFNTDGLPQEIIGELEAARENKKELRRQERKRIGDQESAEDIKRFRSIFPQVAAEEIPESVWQEVAQGVSLCHAYALYKLSEEDINRRAEDVNRRNGKIGAAADSDGATEPVFTKELVEKMSNKDIKSNYKSILKAMKGWKI